MSHTRSEIPRVLVDGQDKAVNWGSRAEGVVFLESNPHLCPPPRTRRSRLSDVGLLQPLSATFLREFAGACESMITHPGFPIQARISQSGSNNSARDPNSISLGWGALSPFNALEYRECVMHRE